MDFRLEEAYTLLRLGYYAEAEGILKEFLKTYTNDSEGWFLMAFCQHTTSDVVFCLRKALGNCITFEKDRVTKLIDWYQQTSDFEYKKVILEIPQRKVEVKGGEPKAWYSQLIDATHNWWKQDEKTITPRMNAFKAEGWEILSDEGWESYLVSHQTQMAFIDFLKKGKNVKLLSTEEKILKSGVSYKYIKETLGVLAAIAFVLIFALGPVGLILVPVIIASFILYSLFHSNNYLVFINYPVMMRRKKSVTSKTAFGGEAF